MRADAHQAFDLDAAFLERVVPLVEMLATKEAHAERALEAGMGAAAFDAAEPGPVALDDARLVGEVCLEIDTLGVALLPAADSLVVGDVVGVDRAEGTAAVLADVLSRVVAPRKPPADLASPPRCHWIPRARRRIGG